MLFKQMYIKFTKNEAWEVFLYSFGVFCFSCVVLPTNYLKSALRLHSYNYVDLLYLLITIIFLITAISISFSILLRKILGYKFTFNLLTSIFLYSFIAQLYFYYPPVEINRSLLIIIAFLICTVFFYVLSSPKLDKVSSSFKFVAHLSVLFLLFLIFYILFNIALSSIKDKYWEMHYNKKKDLEVADQSAYLNKVYNNFKSSSQKKLSIFLIISDELPFNFIFDGKGIKDSFPNLKSLSEKSLFFTNAISHTDYTGGSIRSILTGKYKNKNALYSNSIFFKHRNLISDLKNCGYNMKFFRWGAKPDISKLVSLNAQERFCDTKALIYATLNFIKKIHIFNNNLEFNIYNFLRAKACREIINGIDFKKFKDQTPVFYHIHSHGTHSPYIYTEDGTVLDSDRPCIYENKYADKLKEVDKNFTKTLKFWDKIYGKMFNDIVDAFGEDNVMIIFLADHGVGMHPPRLSRVSGVITWDMVRVPLIIYAPSKVKSRIYDELFPMSDLLPTLYDIIGMEYKEEDFDGFSLFNENREKPREIIAYSGMYFKDNEWILKNNSWENINDGWILKNNWWERRPKKQDLH